MSSVSPSRPKATGLDGRRFIRRVTSTARSTTRSTPANTIALTTQVVPNSSADHVTARVSSRRNAAPRHARSAYGAIRRSGPPITRTAISETSRTMTITSRNVRRDRGVLEVEERPLVVHRRRAGQVGDDGRVDGGVAAALVGLGQPGDDDGAAARNASTHGAWPNAASAVLASRPMSQFSR